MRKKERQRKRARKHKETVAALVGLTPAQFDTLPKAQRATLHRHKHAVEAEKVGSFGLADRLREPVGSDPEKKDPRP